MCLVWFEIAPFKMKILFTYPKSTGFKAGTIPTMSATLPHDWYHRLWLCLLNMTYNQMLLHPWHQVAIMLGAHAAFHHFPSSSLSFLVSACHPAVQRTAAMPRNSEHSSFHLVFIYLPPSLVDSHTHTHTKSLLMHQHNLSWFYISAKLFLSA